MSVGDSRSSRAALAPGKNGVIFFSVSFIPGSGRVIVKMLAAVQEWVEAFLSILCFCGERDDRKNRVEEMLICVKQ